jgi:hypothetical protein
MDLTNDLIRKIPFGDLTTRWNGPGMVRQMHEIIEIREHRLGCDEVIPGRSARSR